jgi:hypothetical protein
MKKINNGNPFTVTIIGTLGLAIMYLAVICINNATAPNISSAGLAFLGVIAVVMGAGLFAIAIISAFMIIEDRLGRKTNADI